MCLDHVFEAENCFVLVFFLEKTKKVPLLRQSFQKAFQNVLILP